MAKSRYSSTPIVDSHHFAPWTLPSRAGGLAGLDLSEGLRTTDHPVIRGERLDQLAARYYGEDALWWVIAVANNIRYPLGLTPGQVLRIPVDPRDVIDRVLP